MSDQGDIELFVKAGTDGKSLGDCPFSHRIQMILYLKGLKYKLIPVNMKIKPRDFLDISPAGKVPVLTHDDGRMDDSTAIAEYLETTFPEPKLRADNPAADNAGDRLFHKFAAVLKNRDPSADPQLKNALLAELRKLNNFLTNSPGTFLDGDTLKLPDCNLLPKLYHLKVAAQHFKDFEIPDDMEVLKKYMDTAFQNEVFIATKYPESEINNGWADHLGLPLKRR
ncbi:chloride intracellular channel protein 5-like [Glandiceps talaboti]